MSKQKTFEEKAKDIGLKDATLEALLKEDIDTTAVLASMQESDIEKLNLTMGQHRLVCSWIKKLTVKPKPKPSTTIDLQHKEPTEQHPATTESLAKNPELEAEVQAYMEKAGQLNGLFSSQGAASASTSQGATATTGKPLLIPDFVTYSRGSYEDEEQEVMNGQPWSIYVKNSKSTVKPRPEDVTMAQWIGANSRIQLELIQRGDLASPAARAAYLRYTSQIGDFAQTSTWPSLMLLDHEFRKRQAKEGFAWDDMENLWKLVYFYLEKRPVKSTFQGHQGHRKQGQSAVGPRLRDNNGIQICRQYNTQEGCTYRQCRYSHCCMQSGCLGKHPKYLHPGADQ